MLGDAAAAKEQFHHASQIVPAARLASSRAFVHAVLGEREPALALLEQLEAERAGRYVPASDLARCYATLGEVDAALRWIDTGIEERTPRLLMLGIDPGYDRLREDARFAERLVRIGMAA